MNDLHDDLARGRGAAPPSTLDLERLHTRRERKQTHRRMGASVVALAICVGLVGGAAAVLRSPGAGDGVGVSPAADGASFAPPVNLTLADGQYAYARTTNYTFFQDQVDRYPQETQTWWATDDSGRIEGYGGGNGVFAAGSFPTGIECRSYFCDLAGLSTDPATLEQQLIDLIGSDGVPGASPLPTPAPGQEYSLTEQLVMAASGLQGPDVSPELKAALFQVLADQPEVAVVRDGTDPVGRPAIELWWHDANNAWLQRVWFDAQTEQPMASEIANVLPAGEDPPTYMFSIVERSGVVDSTSSTDLLTPFFPSTSDAPSNPATGG
jgi:hypothetical protein